MSKQVSCEIIPQVGSVSANNDRIPGVIIAQVMKKAGKDGGIGDRY